MMRTLTLSVLVLTLITVSPNAAEASIANGDIDFRFSLHDHPNGGIRPPLYGLRLDGLQGDTSKEYTFSFDHADAAMLLDIDLDGGSGGGPAVWIHGRAYGGEDAGSGYDSNNVGLWDIDFMYMDNGASSASGQPSPNIDVNPGSVGNLGDMELLSGAWDDGGVGATYNLTDYPNNNNAFHFEYGTHRVPAAQWVGWGWLNHDGFDADNFPTNTHVYASDWLFTAKPQPLPDPDPNPNVPEPTSVIVWSLLGCAAAAGVSRRAVRG